MTNAQTDPVCGMQVDNDLISLLHAGTRHFFCSAHCQQKFAVNQTAYLQPQATGADKDQKKGCCG